MWSGATHRRIGFADCHWCGAQNFEEDHLYAWLFEKQVSPWSYFFSALALLTIMLCCMFPLAPHPVKLAAVYCSMTLIICILCTLTVRSLLALSSWVLLGRSLWLFPHLLSDVRAPAPGPTLPVRGRSQPNTVTVTTDGGLRSSLGLVVPMKRCY